MTTIGTDIEKRIEIQKDKNEIISFMESVVNRPDYIRRAKKSIRFPYNYEASFKSKRGLCRESSHAQKIYGARERKRKPDLQEI